MDVNVRPHPARVVKEYLQHSVIDTLLWATRSPDVTQVNKHHEDWVNLVWFYGISTIIGYLMPNPVFTYILNIYIL